ncbi:hypothetical protein ACP70R_016042 [Stipagrostis hirtigluma subsp. patula]
MGSSTRRLLLAALAVWLVVLTFSARPAVAARRAPMLDGGARGPAWHDEVGEDHEGDGGAAAAGEVAGGAEPPGARPLEKIGRVLAIDGSSFQCLRVLLLLHCSLRKRDVDFL